MLHVTGIVLFNSTLRAPRPEVAQTNVSTKCLVLTPKPRPDILPLMVRTLVRSLLRIDINRVTMKTSSTSSGGSEPPAKRKHWREGLLESMQDPDSVVDEDEQVIVIKDKYPKAHHHFLVLPKENIRSIKEVGKEHEKLLERMEKMGEKVADEHADYEFILGYHAFPTMNRLHLHVVSTDFDSPCLKNKYHWNSFTTPFFRLSKTVREELKEHGHLEHMTKAESDGYLQTNLQCHKCSFKPKNIPALKRHLTTHLPKK